MTTSPSRPRNASDVRARGREVPVLALSLEEAAEAIGVSPETFDRYVRDDLRIVRCGRRRLVSVRELDRWLDLNAARILGDP